MLLRRTTGGLSTNDTIYVHKIDKSISVVDIGLGGGNISAVQTTIILREFIRNGAVLDLNLLNDGQLNVAIGNNVAVDWADLSLVASTVPVPEQPAIALALFLFLNVRILRTTIENLATVWLC